MPDGSSACFRRAVQRARDFARRLGPPAFLGQTDPVLAGDHAAPCQDLRKEFIKSLLDPSVHRRVVVIGGHDVNVDDCRRRHGRRWRWESRAALADLPRTRPTRRAGRAGTTISSIQFRQAGGPERIAEFAPQRPQLFRALLRRGEGERIWLVAFEQGSQGNGFAPHTVRLAIDINEQMGVAFRDHGGIFSNRGARLRG